ncbi:conserved hypothetical protein [Planktothrix serta PCC 8927]|uniref:Uncharacterized protein n=1 Tax=Planktothrix serta PCC 8927 TaxID=671068 RepID=A0A7Z9E2X9_9CYAN|nr:hypothetical protein [Planktothrix serta]VXD22785.1 conserved hypothetical protein [Planktothrix serta PCC 8927]
MSDRKHKNKPLWSSITQKAEGWKDSVSQKATNASKSLTDKATEAAKHSVSNVGEAISHKATEAGKALTEKATEAGKTIRDTTTHSVESTWKKGQDWMDYWGADGEEPLSNSNAPDWSLDELYHIFVAYQTAYQGGSQTVTLKSGKTYTVRIPPNRTEGENLRLKGAGIQGNDAFLVLHSFYNSEVNLDRQVNRLINQAPVYEQTKIRCLEAYNRLNNVQATQDFMALDLLDYLVLTSKLYSDMGQRYIIASHHSRSLTLEQCLGKALETSDLDLDEKIRLKGIYQYVRSGEPVSDLEALTKIDAIILNSSLKPDLKKYYLRGSVTSRVLTLDILIINTIYNQSLLSEADKKRYAKTYIQLREGQTVVDTLTLVALDEWMIKAEIPAIGKVIYQLIRQSNSALNNEFDSDDYLEAFKIIQETLQSILNNTQDYPATGIQTIDIAEVKIDRLAEKCYNSVARGGLGLLSGNMIIKGAVSLVEMTAKVAIAQVAQGSIPDKIKLGIPAVSETVNQSTAIGNNWMAVGSFGDGEKPIHHLLGAAFYRTIMDDIDGVSGLAEPATNKSIPQGLGLLKLLKGQPDKQRVIKDLETRMYR